MSPEEGVPAPEIVAPPGSVERKKAEIRDRLRSEFGEWKERGGDGTPPSEEVAVFEAVREGIGRASPGVEHGGIPEGPAMEMATLYWEARQAVQEMDTPGKTEEAVHAMEALYRQAKQPEYKLRVRHLGEEGNISETEKLRMAQEQLKKDFEDFPTKAAEYLMEPYVELKAEAELAGDKIREIVGKENVAEVTRADVRKAAYEKERAELRLAHAQAALLGQVGMAEGDYAARAVVLREHRQERKARAEPEVVEERERDQEASERARSYRGELAHDENIDGRALRAFDNLESDRKEALMVDMVNVEAAIEAQRQTIEAAIDNADPAYICELTSDLRALEIAKVRVEARLALELQEQKVRDAIEDLKKEFEGGLKAFVFRGPKVVVRVFEAWGKVRTARAERYGRDPYYAALQGEIRGIDEAGDETESKFRKMIDGLGQVVYKKLDLARGQVEKRFDVYARGEEVRMQEEAAYFEEQKYSIGAERARIEAVHRRRLQSMIDGRLEGIRKDEADVDRRRQRVLVLDRVVVFVTRGRWGMEPGQRQALIDQGKEFGECVEAYADQIRMRIRVDTPNEAMNEMNMLVLDHVEMVRLTAVTPAEGVTEYLVDHPVENATDERLLGEIGEILGNFERRIQERRVDEGWESDLEALELRIGVLNRLIAQERYAEGTDRALVEYRDRLSRFAGRMRRTGETPEEKRNWRGDLESYEKSIKSPQEKMVEIGRKFSKKDEVGPLTPEQQMTRATTPTEAARAFFAAQERLYGVFQGYVRGEDDVDAGRLRVALGEANGFMQQWRDNEARFPVVRELDSSRTALLAMIKVVDGAQKNEITREEAMREAERLRRLKPQSQTT